VNIRVGGTDISSKFTLKNGATLVYAKQFDHIVDFVITVPANLASGTKIATVDSSIVRGGLYAPNIRSSTYICNISLSGNDNSLTVYMESGTTPFQGWAHFIYTI
jgi:hypothetical protein